jgi:hypothetical protein
LFAGVAHVNVITGDTVSRIIVFILSSDILLKESLLLIYTVLIHCPADSVHDFVVAHQVRLVFGLELVPYAICSHPIHASIGHAMLRVALTELVYNALLLMVNNVGDNFAIKASVEPLLINVVHQKIAA